MKFVGILWHRRNQFDQFVRQISHTKLILAFSVQAQFELFALRIKYLAARMERFCLAIGISLALVHFWPVKKAILPALPSIAHHIQMDLTKYLLIFFHEISDIWMNLCNIPSASSWWFSKGVAKTMVSRRPKMAEISENLTISRCLLACSIWQSLD